MTKVQLFKSFRYPILALCIWGIFHIPIENFLSTHIVTALFSKVTTEDDPVAFTAVIVLFLLESLLVIRSCNQKKIVPLNILAWGYAVLFLFIYYRFGRSVWEFTRLAQHYIGGLSIADFLLLPPTLGLALHTIPKGRTTHTVDETEGYLSDSATYIDSQNDPDRRYQFVESVSKRIINTKNEEGALAIAVVGKWGTGKTTFLKTVERELRKQKNYIHQFTFNPWLVAAETNVTQAFFSELSDELSIYHSSLQNDLSEYVDHLVTDKDNWLYSAIGFLKKLLGLKPSSIAYSKRRINDILIGLGKKIVIYIDDLDRLDGEETANVIRIIRNSGDFANVIFIVALDKARVMHALETDFGDASSSYLEKVFQVEFFLPPLRPLNLLHTLNSQLIHYLDDKDKPILTEMFEERSYEESFGWISGQIKHYRDLKRYINLFVTQYSHLKQEIYFPDLYILAFLRLKYPEVYYHIYLKKDRVFSNGLLGEDKVYQLERIENGRPMLETILEDQQKPLKLSQDDIKDIIEIMEHLFPDPTTTFQDRQRKQIPNQHLRINQTGYLERYFDLHFYGRLSQVDFDKAFNNSMDKWLSYIGDKKEEADILAEILNFLDWKNAYSTKEEFEKAVEGILKVFGQGVLFDRSIVEKKLNPPGLTFDLNKMRLTHPHHDLFGEKEQYTSFLLSLFQKHAVPGDPFLEYLYIAATDPGKLPLTSNQVIDILKSSFDKALLEGSKFTMDIFLLYANLVNLTKPDELTGQLKNFIITKDIDGFIESAIQPSPFWGTGKYWIATFVREIFGSIDHFIATPEFASTETPQRKAFHDLYYKLKSSGERDAVFNPGEYYPSKVS